MKPFPLHPAAAIVVGLLLGTGIAQIAWLSLSASSQTASAGSSQRDAFGAASAGWAAVDPAEARTIQPLFTWLVKSKPIGSNLKVMDAGTWRRFSTAMPKLSN